MNYTLITVKLHFILHLCKPKGLQRCVFSYYMYFKQTLQDIKDTNNKHVLYSFTVNGGWTGWSRWGTWGGCHGSSCVGQQKKLRTRTCTHPRQRNGGRHCRGSSFEWMSRSCRPVHSKGKINTRCKSENGTFVQTIYLIRINLK